METSLLTTRLTLRPLLHTDDVALLALRSNPDVNRYIDRKPPEDIAQARMFIETIMNGALTQKLTYWGITPHGGDLIGTICLWNFSEDRLTAELGYELHPAYQGLGIMNEAAKKVLDFGFTVLGLQTIRAVTHRDNLRSSRLLVRNGFSKVDEGVFEQFVRSNVHGEH